MNYFKVVGYATLLSGYLLGQAAAAENALLKAPLTACPSDKTVIGGVNACGKTWKIGSGEVALSADGKLTVDVRGLVLNDPSVGKLTARRMASMRSPRPLCVVARGVLLRARPSRQLSTKMAMFGSIPRSRSQIHARTLSF